MSGRRQLRGACGREITHLAFPDSTSRFSGRSESYRLHRPGYPPAIVDSLANECGLDRKSLVADIAAGTGLLAEIFLARGFRVIAVEPNREMREACESLASQYRKLACVNGTAEASGLEDRSVDLITVGQAMHWFDLKRTRSEFVRVLKSGGWCAVIYNNRRLSGDAFHEGYERILIEHGTDHGKVRDSHLDEDRLAAFFALNTVRSATFKNAQHLTREGLMGRVLSSSYMPQPGHPGHEAMSRVLKAHFHEHQTSGHVRMEYDCVVCYGQLG
ncbi:MAG TPA: class I SAM-dependent methyltransferase [Silvibacterium sp.]|nr:class I SAM-dependent methyltransferase [Silvibacterium sp.]